MLFVIKLKSLERMIKTFSQTRFLDKEIQKWKYSFLFQLNNNEFYEKQLNMIKQNSFKITFCIHIS